MSPARPPGGVRRAASAGRPSADSRSSIARALRWRDAQAATVAGTPGKGETSGGGENEREQRLHQLEDQIARALAESERSGELRSAPSFGKPLALADGYDETPAEWRMPMKILKDAGVVPPEVEAMQELGRLREALAAAGSEDEAAALRRRIVDLEQRLALRLEALRLHGSF